MLLCIVISRYAQKKFKQMPFIGAISTFDLVKIFGPPTEYIKKQAEIYNIAF